MNQASMMNLADFGPRVCILGPSNSGKSTLAQAIGRKQGLPVAHLDRLYHLPHTDWQPRPETEFLRLHDEAIRQDGWVMEGNYMRHLPERLERATGLILLDVAIAISLFRYFRRTLLERDRPGALDGQQDTVKWRMVHHIAALTPPKRRAYEALYGRIALPKVRLATRREVTAFYRVMGLD